MEDGTFISLDVIMLLWAVSQEFIVQNLTTTVVASVDSSDESDEEESEYWQQLDPIGS